MGVRVEAAWRSEPQRRAFVYLDASGERTITVIGERLGPRADDPLPWAELERLRRGLPDRRRPRMRCGRRGPPGSLVATVRALDELNEAGVEIDALVSSANDDGRALLAGRPRARRPAWSRAPTAPAEASWWRPTARSARWPAAPLPGPAVDAYGAGDSFAAGFTYGLAEDARPRRRLALGARCGAACVTGRGPYEGQIGARPMGGRCETLGAAMRKRDDPPEATARSS